MFAGVLDRALKRHYRDMITWLNQDDIALRFRILAASSLPALEYNRIRILAASSLPAPEYNRIRILAASSLPALEYNRKLG